jgi:DNA (cytosine-5)-methyltransferase 1
MNTPHLNFFEFFAGGGMARLGLGDSWTCAFANDICEKKAAAYRGFFGESPELLVRDVGFITSDDLPGIPALVWASFPCQDLSLAGSGAGLAGKQSGTFTSFWRLAQNLLAEGRGPKIIVLENVTGALSSHGGRDFETIVQHVTEAGYSVGSLVIDATWFLPQSRPRLFIICIQSAVSIPNHLCQIEPSELWHPRSLRKAYARLPQLLQEKWIWWRLPIPSNKARNLSSLIEDEPTGVKWHTTDETQRILS